MFLLLSSWPLTAQPDPYGTLYNPVEGSSCRAGSEITLQWSPLSPDVIEFELILILEDLGGTSIRLTEQFDADRTSFTWRVPNIPTLSAKIGIRYSVGHGEEWGERSGSFQISPDRSLHIPTFAFREGEVWIIDTFPARSPSLSQPDMAYHPDRPDPGFPLILATRNDSTEYPHLPIHDFHTNVISPFASIDLPECWSSSRRPLSIPQRE